MQVSKQILVVLIIFFLNSCNGKQILLTDGSYNCKKLDEFKSSTYNVEIYSIDIDEKLKPVLLSQPHNCPKDCIELSWKQIQSELEEDKRVCKIIEEVSKLIDTNALNELIAAAKFDTVVYYSACYVLMKENANNKFRYYNTLYFADFKSSKFYIFEMQKGRFFPH